jgi:hypothetical protein
MPQMDSFYRFILVLIMLITYSILLADNDTKPIVRVFHKQKAASLRVLEKVNDSLAAFADEYQIFYYDIEDEANLSLIEGIGLPSTHFPFAVVINDRFTIQRNGMFVSFVHFPDFMKGIGRHEGNWSIADLEAALMDNSLLRETNVLPELDEDEFESKCE